MSAYSIYQKPCPSCSNVVSADATRCNCGYLFESINEDTLLPEEQALQDEELFEAYLAARVDQTVAAVETARADLAVDRLNPRKTARLLQTIQDALTLRDEREAQATKIALAREAASPVGGKPCSTASTKSSSTTPATADTAVQSAEPTDAFKTRQADKAEKIVEAFADTETKDCPHCKTVLPVTSALCCCGYIFSRHDFMLPRAVDKSTRGEMYHPKKDLDLFPD